MQTEEIPKLGLTEFQELLQTDKTLYIELLKFINDVPYNETILVPYTNEILTYYDLLQKPFKQDVNQYLIQYINNNNMLYLILEQMFTYKVKMTALSANILYLLQQYANKWSNTTTPASLENKIAINCLAQNFPISKINLRACSLNLGEDQLKLILKGNERKIKQVKESQAVQQYILTQKNAKIVQTIRPNTSFILAPHAVSSQAHMVRHRQYNEEISIRKKTNVKKYLFVPKRLMIEDPKTGVTYGRWQGSKQVFDFKFVDELGGSHPAFIKPDKNTSITAKTFALTTKDPIKHHHRQVDVIQLIELDPNDTTIYPDDVESNGYIIRLIPSASNDVENIDFKLGDDLTALGMAKREGEVEKELFKHNNEQYGEMAKSIIEQRNNKSNQQNKTITKQEIQQVVNEIFKEIKSKNPLNHKITKTIYNEQHTIINYPKIKEYFDQFKNKQGIQDKIFDIKIKLNDLQKKTLKLYDDYYVIAKKMIGKIINKIKH